MKCNGGSQARQSFEPQQSTPSSDLAQLLFVNTETIKYQEFEEIMSDIAKKVQKVEFYHGQLKKFLANLSKSPKDRRRVAFLKARLAATDELVGNYHRAFEEANDAIPEGKDMEYPSCPALEELDVLKTDIRVWPQSRLDTLLKVNAGTGACMKSDDWPGNPSKDFIWLEPFKNKKIKSE
ncbi:hypothetical protein Bhyg_09631 [Pseudolycoriella hygida]|uniref:Uncharacterized protein n=1 Tax=Pseudolycoriella hygida TaxID=35572 RepID=A0A9Q0N6W7_9DIPT|nr:hypothetical protein Bhyg_09631 [Pseudolycoriella hygida]